MALGPLARSVALAAAVCGVLLSATGEAASTTCRRLEASLGAGQGDSAALARKYDSAIVRQSEALARTTAAYRAASCGVGLFAGARCKTLRSTIRRMEENLGALRARRAGLGDGLSKRDRARILAALAAQGCRGAARPAASPAPTRDSEPPHAAERRDASDEPARRPESDVYRPAPGGRAFCVRTCDGYFFPTARLGDTWRERNACQTACPAAETRLFHRHGGAAADMRAADTGALYRELPTAFLFKDRSVPTPTSCGCSPRPSETGRMGARGSIISFAAPPETPTTDPSEPASTPSGPAREIPADRLNVRAVGPTFLPDPEAAGGRPIPARTSGPSGRP